MTKALAPHHLRVRFLATFFLGAMFFSVAPESHSAEAPSAVQRPVRRLDGTRITPAEIDAIVDRLMKAASVPGLGLAIFNHHHIAYLKGYGLRDTEHRLPLTTDSVMTAASLSKSQFATIVLQLVQEGTLDLDKPVYTYFAKDLTTYPDYVDLAGDDRYKLLTLRILLDHTSGFPNLRQFNGGKLNINFTPGSRFAYSGEGIKLAQRTVEAVTGKPLDQLMRERLYRPLGMSNSSMIWEAAFETIYANGYDESGQSLGPERRHHADAAGSMQTTLHDYATFLEALMQDKILQPKFKKLMLTPQVAIHSAREFPTLATDTTSANDAIHLSYGLGWGLYTTPYGDAFFKEGHDDGWRHYAVCFDKSGSGMLIMTNSANGEGIYKELLESVLGNKYTPINWEGFTSYKNAPKPQPVKVRTAIALDPSVLAAYVGRYSPQPNTVLTITRDGGHLYIQEDDEIVVEIFPESDRYFFAKSMDLQITFDPPIDNQSPSLTLQVKGMTIPAKRLA